MVGLIPRGQPWAQQPPASEPLERSNRLASSALVLVNGPRVHGTPAVRLAPLRGTPQLGVCRFGTGASFTSSAAQSFTAGTARSILAAEDFTIEVLCAMTAVPSLAGFFGTEYPGVIGGATRALIGFGGGSNRNIGSGLGNANAARHIQIHFLIGEAHACAGFQHGEDHGKPVAVPTHHCASRG